MRAAALDLRGVSSILFEDTTSGLVGDVVINSGSLNLSTTRGNTEIDNVISGNGSIVHDGARVGRIQLNATNTYTGGTTVNGGGINSNADNGFGTGALTVNGGTLGIGILTNVMQSASSLQGTGGLVNVFNGVLTVD